MRMCVCMCACDTWVWVCEYVYVDVSLPVYLCAVCLCVLQQVLDWLVQLTVAIEYLHSLRILHRDLKTSNVRGLTGC